MKISHEQVIIATLLIAFAVLTCGSVSTAAEDTTIDDVLSRGKVRVGIALDEPPAGFMDDKGNPAGYQFMIARDLADAMGVELEIVNVPGGAARIPFLKTGKVDYIISCFTRTLERALSVDFSIPYWKDGIALIVREGSDIQSCADLKGKKAGALRGTTCAECLEALAKGADIRLYEYSSDVYLALRQGKVDAIAEGMSRALYYRKTGEEKVEVRFPLLLVEDLCIGVKKGNYELLNWVNVFLYELEKSGKNAEYFEEFFGKKPEPLNIPWVELSRLGRE